VNYYVEIELQLIFYFDGAAAYRNRGDGEIRLLEFRRNNVSSLAVARFFFDLHRHRMGLAMKGKVAGDVPHIRACWGGGSGAEFDLGILRTIEDGGTVHRLLYFGALVCVQLGIEHLQLASVDGELHRARLLVYGSGGERSDDLVFVAGEGKDPSLVDVNGDLGAGGVDGSGLGK